MSFVNLEKLSFVVCPTKFPLKQQEYLYQENFNFWWKNWSAAFLELGLKQNLHSDMYTRQEFTGSLFYDGKCIGQICYRGVDLAQLSSRHDSYFKNWTENALEHLTFDGSRVLISSFLSVSKEYRGSQFFGFSVKDLLLGFSDRLMRECGASSMSAAPRRDRNVHLTCKAWGGVVVEENIPSGYGDFVDLIVFTKNSHKIGDGHRLHDLVESLWLGKTVVSQVQHSTPLSLSA